MSAPQIRSVTAGQVPPEHAGPAEERTEEREAAGERAPLVVQMPVDIRSLSLSVIAVVLTLAALHLAQVVLIPIAFAIVVAYPLSPIVNWLTRRRVPRALAAFLVVSLLVGAGVGSGYLLRHDAASLVAQMPEAAKRFRASLRGPGMGGGAVDQVQEAATEIEKAAAEASEPTAAPRGVLRVQVEEPPLRVRDLLWSGGIGATAFAGQIVVVLALVLYFLSAGDLFKRKLVRIVGPSLSQKKVTLQILDEINQQISRFLIVRGVVSLIVAVFTYIGLKVIGLEHAGIWAVAAGILNTVPYVGPLIVAVLTALDGFMQFGTLQMAAIASGITLVVTTLEGYLVTPYVTSRAAEMNTVAVFVGLLFWGWLWGLWGLLLAVPILLVLKAICDRVEDLKPIAELLGD